MQSGRARTASYAHGRSASVACGLGQLEVALRPRSPSSQPGASRIEWKFDFSCREWMDCLVECEQLGSAGSLWCNMFSGGQQTQARERVLKRALQSNTQDTLEGRARFLFGFRGFLVHLEPTKPKTVGPGVVSLRCRGVRFYLFIYLGTPSHMGALRTRSLLSFMCALRDTNNKHS